MSSTFLVFERNQSRRESACCRGAGRGGRPCNEVGLDEGAADVAFVGLVGGSAAIGEVHDGVALGGCVALLALDGDVAKLSAVAFHEFFRLHEYASGAAGGVIDSALVGREHLNDQPHDAGWGVELPVVLTLRAGGRGEEVFIDAIYDVLVAEADGTAEIDKFAEGVLVQRRAGIVLRKDTFHPRIVGLDVDHGVVQNLADWGLLVGVEPELLFKAKIGSGLGPWG